MAGPWGRPPPPALPPLSDTLSNKQVTGRVAGTPSYWAPGSVGSEGETGWGGVRTGEHDTRGGRRWGVRV